jgi:LacI family transcriptional regulator
VASVVVENHAGAERGTQHLIEHGHRNIHFLGDSPDLFTIKTRHEGYQHALSNAGLTASGCLHCNSEETAFHYLEEVLAKPQPPTALFAGNNRLSRYIFRALHRLHVRIPEQIAIIGFDDFDMADMLQSALTVIHQPVDELGRAAADVLFHQLKVPVEEWPEHGGQTTLKVELTLRASCGCRHAEELRAQ